MPRVKASSLHPVPPSPISKVVIIFLENHTLDNASSEVPGVNGDRTLPPAPDVVIPDPPNDHAAWMRRNDPAPNGARRQRYGPSQLPHLYGLMDAFTVCDSYFSDFAGNSFPNPEAARRTTATDEHALADCIDTTQTPLPPLA